MLDDINAQYYIKLAQMFRHGSNFHIIIQVAGIKQPLRIILLSMSNGFLRIYPGNFIIREKYRKF